MKERGAGGMIFFLILHGKVIENVFPTQPAFALIRLCSNIKYMYLQENLHVSMITVRFESFENKGLCTPETRDYFLNVFILVCTFTFYGMEMPRADAVVSGSASQ